jgi:hypothetical protein
MRFRDFSLPKKVSPLKALFPDGTMPNPLSVDYLLLVVEYRKREYLMAAEKMNVVKWYMVPNQLLKIYKTYRLFRMTAALLVCEQARASMSEIITGDSNS